MRSDHEPAQVRSAIVRETLSFALHAVLYPVGSRRTPPERERRPDQRTLVFVHGLGATAGGFLPLHAWLRLRGHRRQVALNYGGGSIEGMAVQLKRHLELGVGGGRIDLVTHSMGGLVARAYLQLLGGARRVDRLITLGTPHLGTHAANFIPSALVRQLLPESPFIRHLNEQPPPEGLRVTSLVAGRDLLIQPVDAARCPFGDHVDFPDLGHVELLFRPEVFSEVAERLRTATYDAAERQRPPFSRFAARDR